MNRHKKIANACWEEEACWTTRSFSKHGLGRKFSRIKRARNRVAKKIDARWHLGSQEPS